MARNPYSRLGHDEIVLVALSCRCSLRERGTVRFMGRTQSRQALGATPTALLSEAAEMEFSVVHLYADGRCLEGGFATPIPLITRDPLSPLIPQRLHG